MVPQGKLYDGTLAPNKRMEAYISDGRMQVGKSRAEEIAATLVAGEAGSSENQWTPHLYENRPLRQLAVVYDEKTRAYGLTLNQHFYYLPMPMFGADFDSLRAAVFLMYDERGLLTKCWYKSEPNLSGFEYRSTIERR